MIDFFTNNLAIAKLNDVLPFLETTEKDIIVSMICNLKLKSNQKQYLFNISNVPKKNINSQLFSTRKIIKKANEYYSNFYQVDFSMQEHKIFDSNTSAIMFLMYFSDLIPYFDEEIFKIENLISKQRAALFQFYTDIHLRKESIKIFDISVISYFDKLYLKLFKHFKKINNDENLKKQLSIKYNRFIDSNYFYLGYDHDYYRNDEGKYTKYYLKHIKL